MPTGPSGSRYNSEGGAVIAKDDRLEWTLTLGFEKSLENIHIEQNKGGRKTPGKRNKSKSEGMRNQERASSQKCPQGGERSTRTTPLPPSTECWRTC